MHFLNPLNDPTFIKVAYACGVFLLVGLLYTIFSERKRLGQITQSSLFKRLITAAALVPLAVTCIFSGTGPLTIMITALAVIGVVEYSRVTRLPKMFLPPLLFAGVAVPVATAVAANLVLPIVVLSVLAIGTITVFKFGPPAPSQGGTAAGASIVQSAALATLAVAYAPVMGSFVIRVGQLEGGSGLVLALMAAASMSDTMAFVVGKLIGRTKLAPAVSPNKTVEGAVGGVIGAYAGFLILQFAFPALPLWAMATIPFVAAVSGILGDLFESAIKRSYEVKDAGSWLPGTGGLLDRVDSLLFVFPVSYFILALAL